MKHLLFGLITLHGPSEAPIVPYGNTEFQIMQIKIYVTVKWCMNVHQGPDSI